MKILLALIFLASLYSCKKNNSTRSVYGHTPRDTFQNVAEEDAYSMRFINLLLLDSIHDYISSKPNSDIILIQANKCNVCNKAKLDRINRSIMDLTNPIVVVIGSNNLSVQKVMLDLPKVRNKVFYKTADVERLGLSLMENYMIKFRNGLYLSSIILE
jgi:hypothetical protein